MKFTFKTENPTGRYRSFSDPTHHIKLKGKEVGSIDHKKPHYIKLTVYKDDVANSKNPNCEWKWIRLQKEFNSVAEAKEYLVPRTDAILNKIKIYQFED